MFKNQHSDAVGIGMFFVGESYYLWTEAVGNKFLFNIIKCKISSLNIVC